jgi:TRAP-type C4-dicarboxylate transport system permease small subunit
MAVMSRILKGIHWLEGLVLVLLLGVMIAVAVMQIVMRNGFEGGFLWADSFLRVLVLWITMVGALVASRGQRHISIDIAGKYLPHRFAKWVATFNGLFTAAICFLIAWYSLDFIKLEYESPSPAFANVPTWVCESIMPIAFSLIGIRCLAYALMAPWKEPIMEKQA